MKKIDMRFDPSVFQNFIGKKFEKYRCDEFQYTNSVTQIVGMYIDNHVYKMTNIQEAVDYFGNVDDMAVCNFAECDNEDVSSAFVEGKMIDTPVKGIIQSIHIINENQQVFEKGIQTYDVWITRGIIFDIDGREISFEKDNVPFSEEIIIRKGYGLIDDFGDIEEFSEGWDEDIRAVATQDVITIE